jgi:hypothetical protein
MQGAPNSKAVIKPLSEWTLENLIVASRELDIIAEEVVKHAHAVTDFRITSTRGDNSERTSAAHVHCKNDAAGTTGVNCRPERPGPQSRLMRDDQIGFSPQGRRSGSVRLP